MNYANDTLNYRPHLLNDSTLKQGSRLKLAYLLSKSFIKKEKKFQGKKFGNIPAHFTKPTDGQKHLNCIKSVFQTLTNLACDWLK